MLRKLFTVIITAGIVAVLAGIAWTVYVAFNTSEAAHFDASISMVNHQTGRMSESLGNTGTFVSTQIAQITDISTLIKEWTPRYAQAQTAYLKFDTAILSAEDMADTYFLAQRALTERYHSEELRSRAEADDEAAFALYRQWRDRAYSVRSEALNIINRLSDLDTDLQKLKLSSEFSFDAGGFDEVPSEIIALGDELAEFQIASENIREITSSPFDPNRSS